MPELPEVETMRRGILGSVGGKIMVAEKIRCPKKPLLIQPSVAAIRKRIVGKRILAIERIGKRVVIVIGAKQAKDYLIFEPRMTGLVLVAAPPTKEHLRFRMQIAGSDLDEIMYWDRRGLGNITLLNQKQLDERFSRRNIGPDALKIKFEEFVENFAKLNREIKVALLDQKLVAGVGNLYASELLHLAKVHPARKCRNLKPQQFQKIFDQMIYVLETAIQHEGSTLSDGTYRNALNQQGGYQNRHLVYDRAGEDCQQCQTGKIERIVQAQRATFYCKKCQRPPRN